MALTQSDYPTFVSIAANTNVTEAGLWVYAGNSAGSWTMTVRDPNPAAGQSRRTDVGIYTFVVLGTAGPLTINRASADQFAIGGTFVSAITVMPGESIQLINDGGYWVPLFGGTTPAVFRDVSVQSAATLTLGRLASFWSFTGTAATTWTLPALATNVGLEYLIKNKGTADITLQRAGTDQLYTTTAVNSITITPGTSARIVNDGLHWVVM